MSEETIETLRARIADLERQVGALQAENAALREQVAQAGDETLAVNQLCFEQIPVGIGIFRKDGIVVSANSVIEEIFGASRSLFLGRHNVLTDPNAATTGTPGIFEEVLRGRVVPRSPYTYDTARAVPGASGKGRVIWYESLYFPIRPLDGAVSHVGVMTRDVTVQVEQQQALEAARSEILSAEKELAAQRETITALSSPVIQVWEGIITMPLIGLIDAGRAARITQDLLEAIVRYRSDCVILDITGVATVDAEVASYLVSAARACRLLGSEVALVGVRIRVAQILVQLSVDLSEVITHANLQAGLAWAFERRGLRVTSRK
jgi:PAS domain S-box-containing protein